MPFLMSLEKPLVLVTSPLVMERIRGLPPSLDELCELVSTDGLTERELRELLLRVRVLVILEWPGFLRSRDELQRMHNLRLIQSMLAGVDHIPFPMIPEHVMVCSNSGGFSDAVAEHAWALIMAASKSVDRQHRLLKEGAVPRGYAVTLAGEMKLLNGGVFGVIGLGSIGSRAAEIARAFGMRVYAITRTGTSKFPCDFIGDPSQLHRVLRESDVLLLALPLTKQTRNLITRSELAAMKSDAILVNVARGDLVDKAAIYQHLRENPRFRFATDVWWLGPDGRESFTPSDPLFQLPNFICTPHTSGPLAFVKGGAVRNAMENVSRFLRGEGPRNLVRREDYL
jgi:phosphoglycerate dehydrogenase-like enzyme